MPPIRLTLTGELMAESRPGQLTNEYVREAAIRRGDDLDRLNLQREGIYADGVRFTLLRVMHDGRRFEVSVTGDLVDDAIALEQGQTVRLECDLLGEEPHLRLRATKIRLATAPPRDVVADAVERDRQHRSIT
jgi:hypothetical protein